MGNYLFILWSKARKHQDAILADMHTRFNHVKSYEITWSQQFMESNYSRFFEKQMDISEIEKKYGVKPFLLCLVAGEHEDAESALSYYRKKVDASDAIYAALSEKQVNRDVTLLLGKNLSDFAKQDNFNFEAITHIDKDLVGASGWESMTQIFYVLNNTITYCVLRNIETISDDYDPEKYGDIDIMVENLKSAKFVINGEKYLPDYLNPGMFKIAVSNKQVEFDMSYVGDDYMDIRWEKDILRSIAVLPPPHSCGAAAMNPMHQYFTLLYHAYVHKRELSPKYHEKLRKAAMRIGATYQENIAYSMNQLQQFFEVNSYHFTIPSQMEGAVNWNNLRYVASYHKLWKKYLYTHKFIPNLCKFLNKIKRKLKKIIK